MIQNRSLWLSWGLGALIALIIVGYAVNRSAAFIAGPVLTVDTPTDGETLEKPVVILRGYAKNIASLTVNGRRIFTDEQGLFRDSLLLLPGYNVITVVAQDRFNRETKEILHVILK